MGKDHHLTDSDHLAAGLGHEDVTQTSTRLFDRGPIGVEIVDVFGLGCERPRFDQANCGGHVVTRNGPNL